jgi:hypothetical protein
MVITSCTSYVSCQLLDCQVRDTWWLAQVYNHNQGSRTFKLSLAGLRLMGIEPTTFSAESSTIPLPDITFWLSFPCALCGNVFHSTHMVRCRICWDVIHFIVVVIDLVDLSVMLTLILPRRCVMLFSKRMMATSCHSWYTRDPSTWWLICWLTGETNGFLASYMRQFVMRPVEWHDHSGGIFLCVFTMDGWLHNLCLKPVPHDHMIWSCDGYLTYQMLWFDVGSFLCFNIDSDFKISVWSTIREVAFQVCILGKCLNKDNAKKMDFILSPSRTQRTILPVYATMWRWLQ